MHPPSNDHEIDPVDRNRLGAHSQLFQTLLKRLRNYIDDLSAIKCLIGGVTKVSLALCLRGILLELNPWLCRFHSPHRDRNEGSIIPWKGSRAVG